MAQAFLFISADPAWLGSATAQCWQALTQQETSWEMLRQKPDTHIFGEQKALSIDEVRDLIGQTSRRPFQATHALFVLQKMAELSAAAQNALLKLLEEPPPSALLVLWSSNQQAVLPTIQSRCQIRQQTIVPTLSLSPAAQAAVDAYLGSSLSQRIATTAKIIPDKAQFTTFCDAILLTIRGQLLSQPTPQLVATQRRLLQYQQLLAQQVSPKMIADMMALKLPKVSHKLTA